MTGRQFLLLAQLVFLSVPRVAIADAPPGRYAFATPGTVYDTRTKLTWQQVVDTNTRSQNDAAAYCANLSLAGTGWRLPNIRELLTLVDPTTSNPAIDAQAFPTIPLDGNGEANFWSASLDVSASGIGWFVMFYAGNSYSYDRSLPYFARCVR